MSPIPRRSILKAAAVAGAAAQFSWALGTKDAQAAPRAAAADDGPVTLDWLEDGGLGAAPGSTVGVPWPKGAYQEDQTFALADADGKAVPVQSWPIAYWPDGSLKWTAHAVSSGNGKLTLAAGEAAAPAKKVTVDKSGGTITVSTGVITAKIGKSGATLIKSVTRGSTEIARNGRLVLIRQPEIEDEDQGAVRTERFEGAISKVEVEQEGPVRAVVRIDGKHRKGSRSWLPFSIRLYFYAGADSFRMVHTITFDGTQEPGKAGGDFIRGIGVRFTVPMRDQSYDRHIRIGGDGTGLLREAVKGITGLRRDPGAAVQAAQFAGEKLPDPSTWDQRVTTRLQYIPEWGDYTLSQLSADGFTLRKRTKKGHGWIGAGGGKRASGFGYVGGVSGGLSFGLRDFWEKFPAQLDIRDAADRRGRGHHVALVARGTAHGPALLPRRHGPGHATPSSSKASTSPTRTTSRSSAPRTASPAPPNSSSGPTSRRPRPEALAQQVAAVRVLPQLAAPPEQLIKAKVFGPGLYSEPDRSTPAKAKIEDHLDFLFTYYKDQVEQRRWYGFWDYGDIMHTYDTVRHQWRYDIGGYAWDNSELSPDLWLWFAYLRSGRADIFRFAEAMTRHTGEVDVYHLGKWAGLGTRHGVQHYADSAKQQRIANTTYRRYYYFLTADERVGDLMHANVDSDETFLVLDPIRKIRTEPYTPDRHALSIGFGTDWSGLVVGVADGVGAQGPQVGEGQGAGAVDDGDHRRPAERVRTGEWAVRPRHREVRDRRGAGGRGLAPLRRVRPQRTVRRAHRPRRHAEVQRGVLRLLPLLQRHQGRTGGTLRLQLRLPAALPGALAPRRVRRCPDRGRETRQACVGEVLQLRRLQGVGALEDGGAERAGCLGSG